MKARLLLAACCLFVAAGSAAADNGLHQPPLSNAVAEVSPSAVAGGSTAAIVFTFTLGSVPAGITNGELELDAPAGWTFTGVVSNGATTCDVTGATTSFDAAKVVVSGFVCGGGDALLLDLSVDTPTVSADSAYGFDVSFKTRPGGRRRYNNVWRTGQPPITVTATPFLASPSTPSNFVQRVGKTLVLGGNPYTFTGLNAYYANGRGRCGPSVDLGASLDAWGGGKEVMRAWFFQDLGTTEGARDWSAFDQTLATAKAHGYRVIATLANQWSHCDAGYGYKTEDWYRSGYKLKDPSGTVSYRDYVAEIVARYRDDPTILAWQLMNEAEDRTSASGNCPSDAADVLKTWATDVSGLVKSIDPNHLVSLGTLGGGACGTSYRDFRYVHDVPSIDLCEVHDVGQPDAPMPGDQWNGMKAEIDFCSQLDKPLFVGESGIAVEDATLQSRADEFRAKYAAQFAAGVVGELAWLWSPFDSIGYDIGPGDPALAVLGSF